MTVPNSVHSRSEASRVLDWQKDVARSTATRSPPEGPSSTRIVINHISTPVIVNRNPPRSQQENEMSTRALIGTILGASAGAAVAYAMVKGEKEDRLAQEARQATYPVKRVTETAITMRPPLADVRNHQPQCTSVYEPDRPRSHYTSSGPRVETVGSSARSHRVPQSEVLQSIAPAPQSHTARTIVQTANGTKVLAGSTNSRSSYVSAPSKRPTLLPSAAGISLPESRASTLISKHSTIVPDDSISQVSTNCSKDHRRSSHHHSKSKSGTSRRRDSYTSSRTARPEGSKASSRRP